MLKHQPRDSFVVADKDEPVADFPRGRAREGVDPYQDNGSVREPDPNRGSKRQDPAVPGQPRPPRRAPGKHPYSRRAVDRTAHC